MPTNDPNGDCIERLERGLIGLGLVEDARWLRHTTAAAYTTSSEMYGEIGGMVRRIYFSIPEEARVALTSAFGECEQLIRRVWPEFRLRSEAAP